MRVRVRVRVHALVSPTLTRDVTPLVWDSATFALESGAEAVEAGGMDMVMSASGRHVVVLSHNSVYFYDAGSGALEWTQTSYDILSEADGLNSDKVCVPQTPKQNMP